MSSNCSPCRRSSRACLRFSAAVARRSVIFAIGFSSRHPRAWRRRFPPSAWLGDGRNPRESVVARSRGFRFGVVQVRSAGEWLRIQSARVLVRKSAFGAASMMPSSVGSCARRATLMAGSMDSMKSGWPRTVKRCPSEKSTVTLGR
ncbi:hypothetical protein ACFPRL_27250 [Pseudoclavibacter helvolus]